MRFKFLKNITDHEKCLNKIIVNSVTLSGFRPIDLEEIARDTLPISKLLETRQPFMKDLEEFSKYLRQIL